ncbi:MAG: hypothetical protein A4E32_01517 [Methanomassiliicoccales archaeon PtaU1.Bin124]|nr:MAG: hypothetical protein A4E32_01517 [Methanomassiliicoccales archaeon PtaU1.Bin124]
MRSIGRAGLMALGLVFLMAGIILRSMALIGMVLPIALLLMAGMLFKERDPDVRASWLVPEEDIMEGEELEAVLVLSNPGTRSVSALVELTLPEGTTLIKGRTRFPLLLRPGEEIDLNYRLGFPRRGRYDLGDVRLSWDDMTSFQRWEKTINTPASVRVLPYIYPLDRGPFHLDQVRNPAGDLRSRLIGQGLEFHSLRDYSPGDERRRINWKATARSENVIVNQQHTERCGDIVLVVDVRGITKSGERSKRLVDAEVNAACSISSKFLRQRDRVGMLVMRDVMDVVPSRYGKKQFHVIVDRLLEVQQGGSMSSSGLNRMLMRYFPGNSFVLVISPLDDASMVQSIKELSVKGRSVGVLAVRSGKVPGEDEALRYRDRMDRVRWKDDVDDIRSYCQVLEWDADMDLNTCVRRMRR